MNDAITFSRSVISTHSSQCCVDVRSWIEARDDADQIIGSASLPTGWLQDIYEWGPSAWPFYWCDLASTKEMDCGVFADIAQILLERRGYLCARIQIVESALPAQTKFWAEKWSSSDRDSSSWILDDGRVYHEALAVIVDNELLFFDPTEHLAVGSPHSTGGSPTQIRLTEPLHGREVYWGNTKLTLGQWTQVDKTS